MYKLNDLKKEVFERATAIGTTKPDPVYDGTMWSEADFDATNVGYYIGANEYGFELNKGWIDPETDNQTAIVYECKSFCIPTGMNKFVYQNGNLLSVNAMELEPFKNEVLAILTEMEKMA